MNELGRLEDLPEDYRAALAEFTPEMVPPSRTWRVLQLHRARPSALTPSV